MVLDPSQSLQQFSCILIEFEACSVGKSSYGDGGCPDAPSDQIRVFTYEQKSLKQFLLQKLRF